MTGPQQHVERQLSTTLAAWGAASVIVGTALWWTGERDGRESFGRQTTGWGSINLGIASIGYLRARRRPQRADDQDTRRLHRVLVVNGVLDVGYIAAGAALARRADWIAPRLPSRRPYTAQQLRGDGRAIVVQGTFLLVLDTLFAARTRD